MIYYIALYKVIILNIALYDDIIYCSSRWYHILYCPSHWYYIAYCFHNGNMSLVWILKFYIKASLWDYLCNRIKIGQLSVMLLAIIDINIKCIPEWPLQVRKTSLWRPGYSFGNRDFVRISAVRVQLGQDAA